MQIKMFTFITDCPLVVAKRICVCAKYLSALDKFVRKEILLEIFIKFWNRTEVRPCSK